MPWQRDELTGVNVLSDNTLGISVCDVVTQAKKMTCMNHDNISVTFRWHKKTKSQSSTETIHWGSKGHLTTIRFLVILQALDTVGIGLGLVTL